MDHSTLRPAMTHSGHPAKSTLPIDWQQLQQLSDGNEEFEMELLQMFLNEARSALLRAQQAISQRDAQGLSAIGHQLKGASGNIGMVELSRLSRELELAAKQAAWDKATQEVEQISRSLNFVQNFLQTP
jgi:histidine phosphotransfer protein HptB